MFTKIGKGMHGLKKVLLSVFAVAMFAAGSLLLSACGDTTFEVSLNFMVDGELYEVVSTVGNETVRLPENPTKEHYDFDAWYWDEGTWQNPLTANSIMNEPAKNGLSVYAHFTPTLYSITYNNAGDSNSNQTYYTIEDDVTLATPTKDGYNFLGWFSDEELTTPITAITFETYQGASVEIWGSWEIKTSTITFETNCDASLDSITAEYGAEISIPTDLTKEHYTFAGWYTDADFTTAFSSSTMPGSDTTLYAKWTATEWSVTYVMDGGSNPNSLTTATIETNYTLLDASKDGYDFVGWFTDSAYKNQIKTVSAVTEDLTLYAKFSVQIVETAGLQYEYDDATLTATVTGYEGSATEVMIAKTVENGGKIYSVTSIADEAFDNNKSITSLVISSSVTSIGAYAFNDCTSLTSVTFADESQLTTIGARAFKGCTRLKSVMIPASVQTIGDYAFQNCERLTTFDFETESALQTFGASALNGCYNLTTLTLPFVGGSASAATASASTLFGYIFGTETFSSSTETTQKYSSSGTATYYIPTALTSVTVYGGQMLYGAFYGCSNITSVEIGSDVTSIGNYAFYGCSALETVNVEDLEIWCNISFDSSYANPLLFADNLLVNGKILSGAISLSENVTAIPYGTFKNSAITSITIPDNVSSIGGYTFYNCTGLTSITIPVNVTSIGSYAFGYCTGLTSITIPDSVTSIDSGAFSGCSSLESLTLPFVGKSASATSASSSSLFGYVFGTTSYAGGTAATQYYASSSCATYYIPTPLTSVTITGGSILYGAFYNCTGLTSVTIGSEVTSIGSFAFSGCSSLESLTLPFVGSSASATSASASTLFGYIFGTSSYTDGTSTKQYYGSSYATYYIPTSLTSVTITSGSILYGAFYGCSNLVSVTIESGVTSVGSHAFSGCSSLESITLPFVGGSASATTASSSTVFGYIFGTTSYTGKTETTQYYSNNSSATYYIPTSLTSVTITGGSILFGAFYGCSNLVSVTIGSGVTSIQAWAFYGCTALTEINFNATAMGDLSSSNFAFYKAGQNGDGITVNIGANVTKIPACLFYSSSSSYEPKITSVVFAENSVCTSIGDYAFAYCTSLTSITIPDSVTSIGSYAFRYCYKLVEVINLSSLEITAGNTSYGYVAYYAKSVYTSTEDNSIIDTTDDGFQFITVNGTNYLIGYTGTATELTLPDYYNANETYAIYNYAFYKCTSLTSVTIGNGVTSIGTYAFFGCSAEINWGDNPSITEIGSYAFAGYEGTSITIPDSVTSIGDYAFNGCTSLTSITIPDNVTSIGGYAFYYCTSLTAVYVDSIETWLGISFGSYYANPLCYAENLYVLNNETYTLLTELTIPDSVTSIGTYAFSGCSVEIKWGDNPSITEIGSYAFASYNGTSITIPDSVTSIGEYAFYNCTSLTSITISDSVTSIGRYAFSGCLAEIKWGDNPCITEIGSYAFSSYKGTSITIPDSVTSIGSYAFRSSGLTSVTIPDNVTSIESYAFYYCTSLTAVYVDSIETWLGITFGNSYANPLCYAENLYVLNNETYTLLTRLTIPNTITTINDYAFYNCTNLTSITIPDSVTSIGDSAFSGCTALTEINFNATAMGDLSLSNYVFYKAGQSGDGITVNIGANVTKIPAYLFNPYSSSSSSSYAPKITSVVFAENSVCTSIGSHAFSYCTSLTSVTIPDSVTSIGSYAFNYCSSLTSITIPGNVTSIESYAFNYCSSLTSITIPGNVTSIESYAFRGCSAEIKWGNNTSITKIGDYAFAGYNGTSITIPDSVTSIGEYTFYKCTSLTSVTIGNGVTSIGKYAFNGCSAEIKWRNNTSITKIGDYAFADYNGTSITIPDSVTSIGENAFYKCTSLTSITIPDNVTSIGKYAFNGCSAEINWGDDPSITEICDYAFVGYNGTSITIPDSVTSIGEYAFYKCTSLTSVTIGSGVTSIGSYAFSGCSAEIKWGDNTSITKIGSYAFAGYNGTSITIPDSVASIGMFAFRNCTGLTAVYVDSIETWLGISFGDFYANPLYYAGNLYVWSDDETDYTLFTELTIPDSVTSIGSWAFCYCTSLTSITIPDSVTSIGTYAFYDCSNLTSVTFTTTSGWAASSTSISSTDLANTSTAATYLTTTYYSSTWTRS